MFESFKATAALAFTCRKIGGSLNLSLAIGLYTEYLDMNPQDMGMTLELGITYRRTTHYSLAKSDFLKNESFVSRVKKAADNFFWVTDEDTNANNKARAYSELVVMRSNIQGDVEIKQCQSFFRGMSSRKLCLKALELGGDNYRYLRECGRILHRFDWNHAIEVLEKSAKMMPHTATYHHLALAYEKRAWRLQSDKIGFRWKSISYEPKCVILDYDAEDIKNAFKYFEKAVEISLEVNIPALLNYGQLLKSSLKFKEAIVKFNKAIWLAASSLSDKTLLGDKHAQQASIVSAYEQICLCYLAWYNYASGRSTKTNLHDFKNETHHEGELSDRGNLDDSETEPPYEADAYLDLKVPPDKIQNLKEKSESNFMKAISLAARYVNKAPRRYPINLWKSYLIMEQRYKKDECHGLRNLFKLLDVCRQHEKVFQLTKDLMSDDIEQLKQTDMFLGALRSYIALGKYEKALAFFNLLKSNVELDVDLRLKLEIKVNLLAAASRLQQPEENVVYQFQHVLGLHFQSSTGKLDVLILYNEDCTEAEQCSKSEITAQEL